MSESESVPSAIYESKSRNGEHILSARFLSAYEHIILAVNRMRGETNMTRIVRMALPKDKYSLTAIKSAVERVQMLHPNLQSTIEWHQQSQRYYFAQWSNANTALEIPVKEHRFSAAEYPSLSDQLNRISGIVDDVSTLYADDPTQLQTLMTVNTIVFTDDADPIATVFVLLTFVHVVGDGSCLPAVIQQFLDQFYELLQRQHNADGASGSETAGSESSVPLLLPSIVSQLRTRCSTLWNKIWALGSMIINGILTQRKDFLVDGKMRPIGHENNLLASFIVEEESFERMKALCKSNGVSIGSMLAAVILQASATAICEARNKANADIVLCLLASLRRFMINEESDLRFGSAPVNIKAYLPPCADSIHWELVKDVQNQIRDKVREDVVVPFINMIPWQVSTMKGIIEKQLALTKQYQESPPSDDQALPQQFQLATVSLSNNGMLPVDVSRYDPQLLSVDTILGHVNMHSQVYFNVNSLKTSTGTRMCIMCMYPDKGMAKSTKERFFATMDGLLGTQSIHW